MAEATTFPGDIRARGTVIAQAISITTASIDNSMVAANAAIATTKLRHRIHKTYGQSGTATAVTIPVHVAMLPGTVLAVQAGAVVAATGDSTVTVDVKINGTSVLSSTIGLSSSDTAYIPVVGTVDTAADDLVADDVVTVVVSVSAGTGTLPTGLFVDIVLDEDGV